VGSNLLLIGLALVIIGAGIFFPARSARKRDQMRQSWPTAKGTITSSKVVQPQTLAAEGSKDPDQFDVSVQYEFRAGGQLHFGSSVSYPRYFYKKLEADNISSRYPAGATVTVYYNPEDYRECYLEIRNTAKYYRTSIALLILGVLVGLFGVLQSLG
jgi:hypothetical protein